jgi:uncharacterized protein
MRTWKHAFAALALTAGALAMHVPASSQTAPKLQQFVYVLKVRPAFHDPGKWTQKENEAEDEAAARQFMESDPAVVTGLMSATLHPYALALERKQ